MLPLQRGMAPLQHCVALLQRQMSALPRRMAPLQRHMFFLQRAMSPLRPDNSERAAFSLKKALVTLASSSPRLSLKPIDVNY